MDTLYVSNIEYANLRLIIKEIPWHTWFIDMNILFWDKHLSAFEIGVYLLCFSIIINIEAWCWYVALERIPVSLF